MILKNTLNPDIIYSITDKVIINAHNLYIVISVDNIYIGLFELQCLTKTTYIVHMCIKDNFQKQGHGLKAFLKLKKFMQVTSPIRKLIGTIPIQNTNILSIVNKCNAKACGLIKDGVIFDGVLQDLLLFELDLTEA